MKEHFVASFWRDGRAVWRAFSEKGEAVSEMRRTFGLSQGQLAQLELDGIAEADNWVATVAPCDCDHPESHVLRAPGLLPDRTPLG